MKLHFDEKKNVTAIESSEGELVQLSKSVSTKTDQVETWLRELELQVKATLRGQLFSALDSGKGTLQHPDWSLASQVEIRTYSKDHCSSRIDTYHSSAYT